MMKRKDETELKIKKESCFLTGGQVKLIMWATPYRGKKKGIKNYNYVYSFLGWTV